jgi:hypothetical protein
VRVRQEPDLLGYLIYLIWGSLSMNTFYIDDTDFGINADDSYYTIETINDVLVINLEIMGDQQKYDAITEHEDSKWSWTLYPPRLYILDFPLTKHEGRMSAKISFDDLDEYEIGLYLIEHNDLDEIVLFIDADGVLHIQGMVFLSGKTHSLLVSFENSRS